MAKIYYRNEEEWLKAKEVSLGGTASSAILHLNMFESRIGLYRKIKGLDPPKVNTIEMDIGRILEPAIASMMKLYMDIEYTEDNDGYVLMLQHDEYPFISSSPDRMFVMDGEDWVMEIKSTRMHVLADEVTKSWICQGALNAGNAKVNKFMVVWFSSLVDGVRWKEFDMRSDTIEYEGEDVVLQDFYNNIMIPRMVEFKQEYLDKDVVPPVVSAEEFDNYFYPDPETIHWATPDDLELIQTATRVSEDISMLKDKYDYLRAMIKKRVGKCEYIRFKNGDIDEKLGSYKWGKRWKTIDNDKPDDIKSIEEYDVTIKKKKIPSRTLLLNSRASVLRNGD